MFIRIIGFCLGLACAPAYAASIKMEKVTLDSFNELVKGHTWQSSWNKAEVSLFDQDLSGQLSGPLVKVWFAGQALPIGYQFMQLADKTLVKVDQKTYQLISPRYSMLILSE